MQTRSSTRRVYLDYNSTAPCRPEARRAFLRAARTCWGNSSSASLEGRAARCMLEETRLTVARLLGAQPDEIYFTSGGTESNNMAIQGFAFSHPFDHQHIIVSAIEHHSVLKTAKAMESRGIRVTILGCTTEGVIEPGTLETAMDTDTTMVSCMLVNNEVGSIQPVTALSRCARQAGACIHTDAVQAIGRIPIDVRALDVDMMTLSAHKIGAPKGVGLLYLRRGIEYLPLFYGGPQERNRRPGTENVPAIAAFGTALTLAVEQQPAEQIRLRELRNSLWNGIRAECPGVITNGDPALSVTNTLNIAFDGVAGESLMMALDGEGVSVSTGAACSVGATSPSHVLEAMCCGRSRCRASIRFSLGYATTTGEIEAVLEILPRVIARIRAVKAP